MFFSIWLSDISQLLKNTHQSKYTTSPSYVSLFVRRFNDNSSQEQKLKLGLRSIETRTTRQTFWTSSLNPLLPFLLLLENNKPRHNRIDWNKIYWVEFKWGNSFTATFLFLFLLNKQSFKLIMFKRSFYPL